MRKLLEFQADCIESMLDKHQIPVRVTGGTVTPHWVRFQVATAVGAKFSAITALSDELADRLNVSRCRITQSGAMVTIEAARNDPQPVRLLPLYEQLANSGNGSPPIPLATAILGLAEDGAPLLVRLPSPDVEHILIMGMPGTGKTTLLRSIALSLAMSNKPTDLAFVFYGDGLLEVAQTIIDLGFPVHRIEQMGMAAVKALSKTANKRTVHIADNVINHNGSSSAERMSRRMRCPEHHFIIALDGMPSRRLADLFKVRLVGQTNNDNHARATLGPASAETARLATHGDFLCMAEGRTIRFCPASVSLEEMQGYATMDRQENIVLPTYHQPYHQYKQPGRQDISAIEM